MVLHHLGTGIETQLEDDPAHPTFRPIVTPWRKALGDNADARYHDAAVHPAGTYRVRGQHRRRHVRVVHGRGRRRGRGVPVGHGRRAQRHRVRRRRRRLVRARRRRAGPRPRLARRWPPSLAASPSATTGSRRDPPAIAAGRPTSACRSSWSTATCPSGPRRRPTTPSPARSGAWPPTCAAARSTAMPSPARASRRRSCPASPTCSPRRCRRAITPWPRPTRRTAWRPTCSAPTKRW